MRRMGTWMRALGLALLLVLGCKSTKQDLRPPKQPEVLNVPPESESRFTQPLEYPKDTPKASQIKRSGNNAPLTDPSRFQSGAGGAGAGRPY
jgi:hypothetical protein